MAYLVILTCAKNEITIKEYSAISMLPLKKFQCWGKQQNVELDNYENNMKQEDIRTIPLEENCCPAFYSRRHPN